MLSDVVLQKLPDEIKAIIDEVEMVGEGDKGGEDSSGLPGQKKRKVQELAEGIDKGLVIDEDVETVCRLLRRRDGQLLMVLAPAQIGRRAHRPSRAIRLRSSKTPQERHSRSQRPTARLR